MRNCQLSGREEEEWAATKASKPSKLISIKSHCSLRKMEKRGAERALPKGEKQAAIVLLFPFAAATIHKFMPALIAPGCPSLAVPLYRCSKGDSNGIRQEELMQGQRKLSPLGIAPQFSGSMAGSLL